MRDADDSAPPHHTTRATRTLVGHKAFVRHNPLSDRFPVISFHHVEFWCGDATCTSRRFAHGLGMTFVARSDQATGNHACASYVYKSNDLTFAFTAPYGSAGEAPDIASSSAPPMSWYNRAFAHDFLRRHGLAVRALGLVVGDAAAAFESSVAGGGIPVQPPTVLSAGGQGGGSTTVAEVILYGDVVLRFVSGDFNGPFLPGYEPVAGAPVVSYGVRRLDHAVGNVPKLLPAIDYICSATGFHEFAEFVADDVGTVDSGLNSMVLANNNEMVLLPVNEPTFGTRRKSQIQTFLEQNEGPGLQHLALLTDDIFSTLKQMRARSEYGGFEFMPRPSDEYYLDLPWKIGPVLSVEQYFWVEKLGLLVDRDDQGVLLQIFTKPLGDRPTVFIEIIQRLCFVEHAAAAAAAAMVPGTEMNVGATEVEEREAKRQRVEVGGCGGFGKGNFTELFKSIEVYETELGIN
jgi:4-hydroxyphenylpyruvate dioxygenase